MKLLFVHQNLGDFGGAEANIRLAAGELKERGHRVALLYRQGTGRGEELWRELFPERFLIPKQGPKEATEAALEAFAPEVVYLHNLDDLGVLEALISSSLPVVKMVHDHSLYCLRTYKYNYFTRKICTRAASPYCVFPCLGSLKRHRGGGLPIAWAGYGQMQKALSLTRRCARLVVYSEYLKAELVRNGFAAESIRLCVPLPQPDGPEPASTFSDRNLVLFAGQLIRGKGVDILLRALARVKSRFECVLLGDGSHRAQCERLCARLGLSDRVKFEGYVPPAQMRRYYLDASVFVMSSLWPEPFGMAGPEAMRFGLPVVAFDAGGIKEWLHDGENGFVVPWKDTAAFAARLDQLLGNKALGRELGRRGRESVRRYDAPRQLDALEQVFHDVAKQEQRDQPSLVLSH